MNIDLQKINKIYLSYVENDNNELVLSYVFNIVGSENDTMKDNIYSIFVRADTGEIINLNSEIKIKKLDMKKAVIFYEYNSLLSY